MKQTIICLAGASTAIQHAGKALADRGILVVNKPDPDVTHLLLPVPSFDEGGKIRGGGFIEHILADLPETITVIGGNLDHPMLAGYQKLDLLKDPCYLAENAAITADCALRIAANNLGTVWNGCPVLVIGWGRIGKFLAQQLKALGADVTVAARKEADRALIHAMDYRAEDPVRLRHGLLRYRVLFNTAPASVLDEKQVANCRPDCIKIDLASKLGIAGSGVIWARGLPGRDVPESAGLLIAKTAIRLIAGRERS